MPVLDATKETPNMDVIEMIVWVGPLPLAIIYFKSEVGREPCWLDGRQVCAEHDGTGMLIGKIDCPDASAGAKIEHVRQIVRNWSEIELALECQREKMMGDVKVILCLFVIWTPIFAQLHMPRKSRWCYTPILVLVKGMVSTTVLSSIASDPRGQGLRV